ncbi:NosD domain-containing protein [Desulfopila aestuarii]|uniref:Parallel beta-helix repeat (Two copies) n=1 Tax=Desulfopila aestuarii DSM 18488 TaxID=1121416 RepID=A0A1M7YFY0_9BACT|nr:NosD domain-containing protein [Desulfopila aestuarii]SHO51486.1 parallel beta-helix repeat (two copies) [Desulfopila aestuarii DSM 18488]
MFTKFYTISISIAIYLISFSSAYSYSPPTAIPSPGLWGTTNPIDTPAPDPQNRCPSWPSNSNVDCYYIDASHSNSTDSSNPLGYPDKPRISIPEIAYNAGSYVSINNSSYTGGSQIITTFNGTASSPVWVVGKNMTAIREWIVKGSYVIFDNIDFSTNYGILQLRPHNGSNIHHFSLRNSNLEGSGTYGGNGSAISIYGDSTNRVTDIIIYNNTIQSFGDNNYISENDFHGILPTAYSNNIWILNNNIFNNGGDSIQVGSATLNDVARPHHIFIANNTLHDDRENAIDIKRSQNVIVYNNTCYNYSSRDSSAGEGIVVHDSPDNVWVINNIVHNSTIGITSTGSTNTFFIGNVVYSTDTAFHIRGATTGGIFNNSLSLYKRGITVSSNNISILNNILSNREDVNEADLSFGDTLDASTSSVDYTLFSSSYSPTIQVGSTQMSIGDFKASFGKCNILCEEVANIGFLTSQSNDFRLSSTSIAIDKGFLISPLSLFSQQYALDLNMDYMGNHRPSGSTLDIGAFEYPIDSPVGSIPPTPQTIAPVIKSIIQQ